MIYDENIFFDDMLFNDVENEEQMININNNKKSKSSCTALKRPLGDSLAPQNNPELQLIKYDILCEDMLYYIGEIVELKGSQGVIHFPFWSSRFDYRGDISELYLADYGSLSTPAGLNLKSNR
jgi:hypothetical protein